MSKGINDNTATYTVDLRADQLDLIVLAMQHVRNLMDGGASAYAIDTLGRKFLRRRCLEIEREIQSNYPEAGK